MTKDTIEEIVDQVMVLIETHGLNTSEYAIYWDQGEPEALKSDILQTLKDYGDGVRGEVVGVDFEDNSVQCKDLSHWVGYQDIDEIREDTP